MANLIIAASSTALLLVITADASWLRPATTPLPIDLHIALTAVAFVLYAVLVVLILRHRIGHGTLRWLFVAAVLLRVIVLVGPHRYNSDVWRYVWDGHVLAQGVNPYAHSPDHPALDPIRDPDLYNNLNPDYNHIPTVYGPVAATCFAACSCLPGDPAWTIRLLMTIGDLATLGLVALLLRQCGLPVYLALVYGLNPLLLDSFAQRGQVEGLMLPLLVAAALLLAKRRPAAAGVTLAAASLVKVVAIVLLPLLLRKAWEHDRKHAGRLLIGFVLVMSVGGLPIWLAGPNALRGLATYAAHWRTNDSLYTIAEAIGGTTSARAFAAIALITALATCLKNKGDILLRVRPKTRVAPASRRSGLRVLGRTLIRKSRMSPFLCRTAVILGAVLLLAPAVFPWYVTWLLPWVPFFLASPRWKGVGVAMLCWSATVMLWYCRFLAYPPLDDPYWPSLARMLQSAHARLSGPWRIVEYAPVFGLLLVALVRGVFRPSRGAIAPEPSRSEPAA